MVFIVPKKSPPCFRQTAAMQFSRLDMNTSSQQSWKQRIHSLGFRLPLIIVSVVLLTALAISGSSSWVSLRDGQRQVMYRMESVIAFKETQLLDWCHGLQEGLQAILDDPKNAWHFTVVLQPTDSIKLFRKTSYNYFQLLFQKLITQTHWFEELFLLDATGTVVLSTIPTNEGRSYANMAFAEKAISPPIRMSPDSPFSVLFFSPVADPSGKFVGSIIGRAGLEVMNGIMETQLGLDETGETFLIETNAMIVTATRTALNQAIPYHNDGARQAMAQRATAFGRYENYAGDAVVGMYRWIPELQVIIAAEQLETKAFQVMYSALRISLSIAGVAVLIAMLIGFKLTRKITLPLNSLAQAARQIADGEVVLGLPYVTSQDEIGVFTQAFETMLHRLNSILRELDELIRSIQEGKLSIRGHADDFTGRWRELVVGVNLVIDAFVTRIVTTSSALDRLSRGDVPEKVTAEYHGDFNTIKNHLNLLIDVTQETTHIAEEIAHGNLMMRARERSEQDRMMQALNLMITRLNDFLNEMDGLVHTVKQGKLESRGRTEGFEGGWRDLVSGVNDVLNAFAEMTMLSERLKEENLRMSAEIAVTRRLQMMILPPPEELQQIEELEIVGFMQSADEVGGDYYDALKGQGGIINIGIGDVTGHGLESGVLMLMTQTAIRTLIEHGETDPVALLETLNRTIYKNIQRMKVDRALTLAFIHYQGGVVKIVGQHEEMLIVRQGGQVERVDTINLGFPLGLVEHISHLVSEYMVTLHPGESVVLYTDGITEAENTENVLYGLDRLCQVLSRNWNGSAEAIKQAIVNDVIGFIGQQVVYDDLTLVVLKQK